MKWRELRVPGLEQTTTYDLELGRITLSLAKPDGEPWLYKWGDVGYHTLGSRKWSPDQAKRIAIRRVLCELIQTVQVLEALEALKK